MKKLAVIIVAVTAITLFCLFRIGTAVYDYQVSVMDLNAPVLPIKPSAIPAPPVSKHQKPQPPPPPSNDPDPDPCAAYNACPQRVMVYI